jgi:excisionase family DNA binding protein
MARLNISRATTYRLIAEGHFKALKVGGCLRITEKSLEDYLERQIYRYALQNGVSDFS